jgi:hypothetical protein
MGTDITNEDWLKAERIANELLHEKVSLWYASDGFGSKIMLKIPTPTIKSLLTGCAIQFSFGKDSKRQPPMFHAGVRIYDDPVHYLSVTGIQRYIDEHTSLEKIMHRQHTDIQLYNELNVCVATATVTFEVKDQMKVLHLLGCPDQLYCGDFDKAAFHSLDCFDYSLQMERILENVYEIETLIIDGQLSNWHKIKHHFIGVNEQHPITANDPNEGETFERQVWVSLESLFDYHIYCNPTVPHKKGQRELTDIFAYSCFGLFLFETKALSILTTDPAKTMEQKVRRLQQHIEKAIDQLTGAAKKILEKPPVFDRAGNEIQFDKTLLPHCVVLVSELLPFGDWKVIEMKMFEAMIKVRMYLNVLDLKEFMRFVGMARGSRDRLDYLLIKRVEHFVKHRTIHLEAVEVFPTAENT